MKKIFKENFIIFIIVIFIMFALPGIFYSYSLAFVVGDEVPIMASALKMIYYGTLRPAFTSAYTMPFASYLYLPFYIILLSFLRISGLFASLESIERLVILDYAKLLPLARFISIIFGALSVYLIYKICQKLFKEKFISLTASFLFSTSLMFVQLSHFGRVWIPQIFIILLTFYFIADLYNKKQAKIIDYIKISILIGISLGTHFIGILIYLPFLVVHFLKNKKIINKNFLISNLIIFACFPIFYYINPYSFNNYFGYILSLFSNKNTLSIASAANNKLFFYLKILLEYELILLAIFISSIILFFIKKRNLFYIFFSFIFGYYFVVEFILNHKEPRYILPIIPFMAIMSAYGLYYFYKNNFIYKKIKIIILAILFFSLVYLPILWNFKFIQPNTRMLAMNWIYENLPINAKIINLDDCLELNKNKHTIENIKNYNINFFTKKDKYLLELEDSHYPKPNYYILNSHYINNVSENFIQENKFEYLIIYWWNNKEKNKIANFIQEKKLNLELVANFYPANNFIDLTDLAGNMRKPFNLLNSIKKTGPYMEIYKIN